MSRRFIVSVALILLVLFVAWKVTPVRQQKHDHEEATLDVKVIGNSVVEPDSSRATKNNTIEEFKHAISRCYRSMSEQRNSTITGNLSDILVQLYLQTGDAKLYLQRFSSLPKEQRPPTRDLWQAIRKVEYQKYDIKDDETSIFAAQLQLQNIDSTLPIEQKLQLLSQIEPFNRYLEMGFRVGSNLAVSPSLLFAMASNELSPRQIKQILPGKQLSVHDLAAAIRSGVNRERLQALLDFVEAPMNIPVLDEGSSMPMPALNLADVAASSGNIEALSLLWDRNIKPTNLPGVVTGLDYALQFDIDPKLTTAQKESVVQSRLPAIRFLLARNYRAHGSFIGVQNNFHPGTLTFHGPLLTNFSFSEPHHEALRELINPVNLIGSEQPQTMPTDAHTEPLRAIAELTAQSNENTSAKSKECENLRAERRRFENLDDNRSAYQQIQRVSEKYQDHGEIQAALHAIDPALVELWRKQKMGSTWSQERRISLQQLNDEQWVRHMLATQELDSAETDEFLENLAQYPERAGMFSVRLYPKPPRQLDIFIFSEIQWFSRLEKHGFDFSLTDIWGRNVFFPVLTENNESKVRFLLEHGVIPGNPSWGMDALDIVLERCYVEENVPAYFDSIALFFPKAEISHLRRMSRLGQYYPTLYQQIIQRWPHLEIDDKVEPNRFIYLAPNI